MTSSIMLRRIAEIDDELKSRGAIDLISEKDKLKNDLKNYLIGEGATGTWDEESGLIATLVARYSTTYNVDKLDDWLSETQQKRYIKRMVDVDALKEGVKIGDLNQSIVDQAKEEIPQSMALYIRKLKENESV